MIKRYFCCICHKELKEEKPIRLIKQIYGAGKYKQYYQTDRYDICKRCYFVFDKWLQKHKK